jgi:hypothetical protein
MTPEQLVYWLNGFFELSGTTTLNEEQVKVIKEHIALVVHKVTPSTVGSGSPQQTRGPYTFPVYPDPSVPWYNPFVDPSKTQMMGAGVEEQQSKLTIPPFEVKDSVKPHLCENCVIVCPNAQNKQDHNGRICPLCKVYCKNLDAKDLPIINVKTHLSC